jgi:enamine deaminase RidA (YjgF/YER057c/UK114 family)
LRLSHFAIVGGDDLAEQTKAARRNIKVALDAIGATWEDVHRRTIYRLQPTQYETITAAIEEVQGPSDHPAQTIVGVTGLALDGLLIEIETTVVHSGRRCPQRRRCRSNGSVRRFCPPGL